MMLTVHGRILTAPPIQYKKESKTTIHAEWNLIGSKFYGAAPIPNWSYLCVGRATLSDVSIGQFRTALARCGMVNAAPSPSTGFRAELRGSGDDDTNDKAICNALNAVVKMEIPILLVILDSPSAAIYARIKYWADTTFGMCLMSSSNMVQSLLTWRERYSHRLRSRTKAQRIQEQPWASRQLFCQCSTQIQPETRRNQSPPRGKRAQCHPQSDDGCWY